LASAGPAISVNSLSAGRAAMRLQKDGAGDYISIEAKYLVVPPELEQVANQFTSTNYVAAQSSNINPQYNTKLEVIVEPRLSANSTTAWYLVADPSRIPTIEYSFLEEGFGYNVKTGEWGNLIEMGVIDPFKVTRSALQNAVSVATTILSTDAIITMARTYQAQ